jgi:hypothetical protein
MSGMPMTPEELAEREARLLSVDSHEFLDGAVLGGVLVALYVTERVVGDRVHVVHRLAIDGGERCRGGHVVGSVMSEGTRTHRRVEVHGADVDHRDGDEREPGEDAVDEARPDGHAPMIGRSLDRLEGDGRMTGDGDRQHVIETPAHNRAARRLIAAQGSAREALAAIEPGFDLDDLAAYVWSGSPSLPERYVPLVSGMAAALILLGYEIGAS